MRQILIAGLLAGASFLLPAPAGAASRSSVDAAALLAPASIEQTREAGEARRREDRRQDRRQDRRRASIGEGQADGILLVREGGSRNRGRRGP